MGFPFKLERVCDTLLILNWYSNYSLSNEGAYREGFLHSVSFTVSLTFKMFLRSYLFAQTRTLSSPLRCPFPWPRGFFLPPVGTSRITTEWVWLVKWIRPQALNRSRRAWFQSQHWVLNWWPPARHLTALSPQCQIQSESNLFYCIFNQHKS